MVQMTSLNSNVFYFPQGHAEHAQANVDLAASLRIHPLILCRVAAVRFLNYTYADDADGNTLESENSEKPASFAKTLTQSDANNGWGFFVPRYCTETIFPRIDYSAEPPFQIVIAKDVHG